MTSVDILALLPTTTISRAIYTPIYNFFGEQYLGLLPLLVTVVSEVFINGIFTYFDLKQFPWMKDYRIDYCTSQLGNRKYPTIAEIKHGAILFCQQFCRVILPLEFLTFLGPYMGWWSAGFTDPAGLNDLHVLVHFLLAVLFADFWNYTWHRIMHYPWLFRRFHKLHHEYTYTFVWVNHAFHDIEVLLYGFSVVAPALLFGSHAFVVWLFTAFTVLHTGYQHSGYYFPFLGLTSPLFHDAHHYLFNKNFSAHTPYFDMIYGTYAPNTSEKRKDYTWVREYVETFPRPKSFIFWKTALSR